MGGIGFQITNVNLLIFVLLDFYSGLLLGRIMNDMSPCPPSSNPTCVMNVYVWPCDCPAVAGLSLQSIEYYDNETEV